MKRLFITGGFVVMVVATLIMPGFPALHYYMASGRTVIYSTDQTDTPTGSLVSDLNYLNALIKRTSDIQKEQNTKTPPKPQKEGNSFVYLIPDILLHLQLTERTFRFMPYVTHWHNRFIPIGNPPPKA